MRVLHDWVYIRRDKQKQGLIILDDDDTGTGEVEFTGPGTKSNPMTVKPGDRVQWDRLYGAGLRSPVDDDCLFIKINDVWAII